MNAVLRGRNPAGAIAQPIDEMHSGDHGRAVVAAVGPAGAGSKSSATGAEGTGLHNPGDGRGRNVGRGP